MSRAGNEKTGNQDIVVPVKAGVVVRELTIAALDATGYAVTGSKTAGLVRAGCYMRYVDNRRGSDGAEKAQVRRGVFVWNNDGTIKETDLLKKCYIAGEQTVTITASGASEAGVILAVDDDGVTVDMM